MPWEEFENLKIPNSKKDDVMAVIIERFKELDFKYDPAIKDKIYFKYLAFYDQLRQLRQGDNPKTR